ncbi:MAG: hypothetical protein KY455_01595 [Euryarchaeota archaeon]|nr:hypothetical protein [Euryarchaeota archaeon]
MKTFTRFLALLITVLMMTAGAALGSIAVDLSLDAVPRSMHSSDISEEETEDDADSGRDAGDSKGAAIRLQNPGRYSGHLKDLDSDWYAHGPEASGSACVQATAGGERLTDSTLEPETSLGPKTLRAHGGSVTFGLAAADFQDIHFGFRTDGTKQGSKAYDFSTSFLSTSDITSDHGGSDASGTLVGATSSPHGCFGGTLNAGAGDTADVYTFSGTAGDRVVFTMAQGPSEEALELSLIGPDGSVAGRTASGGSIAASLDATGSWYLAVEVVTATTAPVQETTATEGFRLLSAESDSDYTIGACRPLCVE